MVHIPRDAPSPWRSLMTWGASFLLMCGAALIAVGASPLNYYMVAGGLLCGAIGGLSGTGNWITVFRARLEWNKSYRWAIMQQERLIVALEERYTKKVFDERTVEMIRELTADVDTAEDRIIDLIVRLLLSGDYIESNRQMYFQTTRYLDALLAVPPFDYVPLCRAVDTILSDTSMRVSGIDSRVGDIMSLIDFRWQRYLSESVHVGTRNIAAVKALFKTHIDIPFRQRLESHMVGFAELSLADRALAKVK